MRSLPVFALPEVEAIFAPQWRITSWRTGGAEHIRRKYDETVSWIAWNPEAFPRKHGPVRRAILKHSYYIIYFVVENDRSLVLAVLDGRRAPEEIRSVVEKRRPSRR